VNSGQWFFAWLRHVGFWTAYAVALLRLLRTNRDGGALVVVTHEVDGNDVLVIIYGIDEAILGVDTSRIATTPFKS
jgi:hypothetical protein